MLQSKEENNAECGWLNGQKVSESIFAVKDMAFNTKWLRKTYLLVLFLEFLNEIRDRGDKYMLRDKSTVQK